MLAPGPAGERADRQGRHDHAVLSLGPGALPGARRGRQAVRRSRRRSCSRPSSVVTKGADRYSDSLPQGRGRSRSTRRSAPSSSPATRCTVIVSKGPAPLTVPNVIGKNLNEARQILAAARPAAAGRDVQGQRQAARTRCSSRPRPTAPASRRAPRSSSRSARARRWSPCRGWSTCRASRPSRCCESQTLTVAHRRATPTAPCPGQNPPENTPGAAAVPQIVLTLPVTPGRSVRTRRPRVGWPEAALPYVDAAGSEAVQVYVSNSRGWALPPGDPAQDDAVPRRAARERGRAGRTSTRRCW